MKRPATGFLGPSICLAGRLGLRWGLGMATLLQSASPEYDPQRGVTKCCAPRAGQSPCDTSWLSTRSPRRRRQRSDLCESAVTSSLRLAPYQRGGGWTLRLNTPSEGHCQYPLCLVYSRSQGLAYPLVPTHQPYAEGNGSQCRLAMARSSTPLAVDSGG